MTLKSPTIGAALAAATFRLRECGSPSARLDAEVLLAHVAGHDRSWVLAHPDEALEGAGAFEAALVRRAAGEPIAYIRGFKEWRSLRIRTDPRGLIPRPETELLAEQAMATIAERLLHAPGPLVAWEVATGSGAVAVALALRFASELASGRLRLIASDVSSEAVDLAADNLAAHDLSARVTLVRGDLLEPAGDALPRPEVVVANLPYVASDALDAPQGSLAFEPRLALDGGPDGLAVIRRLAGQLPEHVAPGATVLLEIGADQAGAMAAAAPVGASVSVLADLAGHDRVVRLGMPA